MEIMQSLSDNDLNKIKYYINDYAGNNSDVLDVKVSDAKLPIILRFWEAAKQDLYEIFDSNLILTKPITFKQSCQDEEALRIFDEKIFSEMSEGYCFIRNYESWVESFWNTDREVYWKLFNLISTPVLFDNTYTQETFNINNKIVVTKGCKVSRILGKIAREFSIDGYEEFRQAHSMCINQKALKGEICLSIHPLDYMTMSDNDCDWSSCMSWRENGEYRQGTVEMMNSPYVVVAYLKSSKDMRIIYDGTSSLSEANSWNNKKWRQLYIVHKDVIMAIKQYPYANDTLSSFCLNWLKELTEKSPKYGPYHPNMCQIRNGEEMTFPFLDHRIFFEFTTHHMYNDIYSSHDAYIKTKAPRTIEINYSGPSECLCCGDEIYRDRSERTDSLLCDECGGSGMFCDECGSEICGEEYYTVDGVLLCSGCYTFGTESCECCQEIHLSSCCAEVILKDTKENELRFDKHVRMCDYCMSKNVLGNGVYYDYHDCVYAIKDRDLNEYGRKMFKLPKLEDEF